MARARFVAACVCICLLGEFGAVCGCGAYGQPASVQGNAPEQGKAAGAPATAGTTPSMTSIDLTTWSHSTGVEMSGVIGAPALFLLTMHIDYRDNLVKFEYTPKN